MKNQLRVYYDGEGDFLEISTGEPREGNATEVEPGVFVRRDESSNVLSIGILGFKDWSRKHKNGALPILASMQYLDS
ncbi:MAG: DUF2283 domain-containing protein [Candidatus Woesearchaeota archaeon]